MKTLDLTRTTLSNDQRVHTAHVPHNTLSYTILPWNPSTIVPWYVVQRTRQNRIQMKQEWETEITDGQQGNKMTLPEKAPATIAEHPLNIFLNIETIHVKNGCSSETLSHSLKQRLWDAAETVSINLMRWRMCNTLEQLAHGFNSQVYFMWRDFLYHLCGHYTCILYTKMMFTGRWGFKRNTETFCLKVRQQQGSNLRGGTPIDFKSIALTTRPYWQLVR